ncbi:MAG: hypothetical protein WA864_23635 [Acetobacteraceae bacterium]
MSAFPRLPACLVIASLLTPFASAWSAAPTDPSPALDGAPGTKASFAHSGLKTVTYEIGNTLNNFAFLTVGTRRAYRRRVADRVQHLAKLDCLYDERLSLGVALSPNDKQGRCRFV